ncbi:MAG: ABC transporter permease, partial [Clostridia bacterium]|nr:ABC transporter permease [Clostridia bacterium]
MRALTRRLIRLIWKTKGQFTAIASVVAVGVTVYIAMSTAFLNLEHSRDLFYKEMNFADYYFRVVRAPEAIKKTLETLPGVSRVTARITRDIALLRPDGEKISGRLISYPLPLEGEVNGLKVLSGRLFEKHPRASGIEVLVDPQFARANGLSPGDSLALVIEGEKYPVTVVGTAIGPEFIYPLKDTSTLLHDPSTFGIIMLPLNQAQALLNLPAQVNEVVLTLLPGAEPEEVEKKIKEILEPYGNVASYPRKQQLSHAILDAELKQLQTSSRTLPTIFLLVASAIEFFVCGRMVRSQRQVIGTLKALGYTDREIILHYAGYSLAISLTGTLTGSL